LLVHISPGPLNNITDTSFDFNHVLVNVFTLLKTLLYIVLMY